VKKPGLNIVTWEKILRNLLLVLFLVLACNHSQTAPPHFPEEIGDLKLTNLVIHDQALREVDRIHDRRIAINMATIAYYQGKDGPATIWWSESATASLAKSQMERMIHKIRGSKNTPYGHYRKFQWNGILIHSLLGKGQLHYTFVNGKQIYWISANPHMIDTILNNIMEPQ